MSDEDTIRQILENQEEMKADLDAIRSALHDNAEGPGVFGKIRQLQRMNRYMWFVIVAVGLLATGQLTIPEAVKMILGG